MFKFVILIIAISPSIYCDDVRNNATTSNRRFYFRQTRPTNEIRFLSRIHYASENNSASEADTKEIYYVKPRLAEFAQEVRVSNFVKIGARQRDTTNDLKSFLLDQEWNFNHSSINKTALPQLIHRFHEQQLKDLQSNYPTKRILFNVFAKSASSIIKFNLDSLKDNETVLDGEMYFFWPLDESSDICKSSVVLKLYQLEEIQMRGMNLSALLQTPDIFKLLNVIYISKAERGWQTFKLTRALNNWLNGEANLGLLLTISSYTDNKLLYVFNDTNTDAFRTFAVMNVQNRVPPTLEDETFEDELKSLSLINVQHSTLDATSATCQKLDWKIDFRSFNWDQFIVAPLIFNAYDCFGSCDAKRMVLPNHVQFIDVLHKRASYCVATSYLSLPIMFYDKYSNIVIKNYDRMIVNGCGCK